MPGRGQTQSSASELIDDRALETADEDLLRHDDLAAELADVITTVQPPASIALWGPWGSGKSGLGHLLKAALKTQAPKARFVKFDAFKFAETPLRRHFISQVAAALEIKDEEFSEGLYRETNETELVIPKARFLRLLLVFLGVVLVVEVAAVALMAALAGISAIGDGNFHDSFDRLLVSGLALALAPAGLLAAFTALAGQTLPVKKTTSAPSSDEEFERLFVKLVKKAKAKPLVVFIDELDRCSAEDVVSTLEAIRTFLDVKGVIYVVAADQQVLERALRKAARQTTPPDAINPYYSAGSAYLDKIFQFQMSVPPVRTSGLSKFALKLTDNLGGVWKEIDRPQVLSVLIPTHVRSPRRVKRLLNAFVLTQRLARRRIDAERVDGPIEERMTEIAKLTCLQIEFPLFAIDLSIEPKLTELVLQAHRNEKLPGYLPPEVRSRAERYARGELNVDEVLATDTGDQEGARPAVPPTPSSGHPEIAEENAALSEADTDKGAEQVAGESGFEEREDEKKGSEVARVKRIHAEQLLRYLQKTRDTKGPKSDLVFMESRGAPFGLDATVADVLSDAAIDADLGTVAKTINALEEPKLQRAGLELLAQRGKEAAIGVGGQNAIASLLHALSVVPDLNLDGIADTLADAVAAHEESDYSLEASQLKGALALAAVSGRDVSKRLMKLVLNRPEAVETELGLRIIAEAERIPDELRPRLNGVAVGRLLEEPAATVDALTSLKEGSLQPLLASLVADLPDVLTRRREAEEAEELA